MPPRIVAGLLWLLFACSVPIAAARVGRLGTRDAEPVGAVLHRMSAAAIKVSLSAIYLAPLIWALGEYLDF